MEVAEPLFMRVFHTFHTFHTTITYIHTHTHTRTRARIYVYEELGMEGMEGMEELLSMRLSGFHTCSIPSVRYGTFSKWNAIVTSVCTIRICSLVRVGDTTRLVPESDRIRTLLDALAPQHDQRFADSCLNVTR